MEARTFEVDIDGELEYRGPDPLPYINKILEVVKEPVTFEADVYEVMEDGDHEVVSVAVLSCNPYRVIQSCPNYSLTPGFTVFSYPTCEAA